MHARTHVFRVTHAMALPQTLGQGAVHASFAAYTAFSVSMLKTHFVLLPTQCLNKVCPRRVPASVPAPM